MGKLIKWLLGVIVVLVLLLVVAVIVLPRVIDPNDYKDQIVSLVKERTGRDLQIDDKLSLSVFPWLGIETGGVTLGNARGFGDTPFAQVHKLDLRVKLLPLLSRRLEVDTLVLDGLRLNLERDKAGQDNWADLAGGGAKPTTESTNTTSPADHGTAGGVSLQIQGIQVKDAQVSWRDDQTGDNYLLKNLRLTSGSLQPGATVPIEAGFTLTSEAPQRSISVDMQAKLTTNADFQEIQVDGLQANVQASGEGLSKPVTLKLATQLSADLGQGKLKVPTLTMNGAGLDLSGSFEVSGLNGEPQTKGTLRLAKSNLKQLADTFGVALQTADPKALTAVSAEVQLATAGKALRLDPIAIRLDDSKVDGYLHLLDPQGPVVRVSLNVDKINLDNYLPPQQAPAAEQKPPQTTAGAQQDPFEALRTLDLQAQAKVGELVVNKAKLSDVTLKATSKAGVLKLDPMSAKLYQGGFDGKVTFDVRQAKPRLHATEKLTGIDIGSLLTDVAGQDRLTGKGDLALDLSTVGLNESEVRRSLNGNGSFRFEDGSFRGVNLAKIIRTAGSALGLTEAASTDSANSANQTDFSEMSGSFKANNGVISNDDLQAKSPLLRIAGKGTVNLPKDTVDYSVTTVLVKSLEGQGGKARDELTGLPIPVKIQGPLTDPSYKPDLQGLVTAKAKQRIEQEKEKVRTRVESEVNKALQNKLKGLFGQ